MKCFQDFDAPYKLEIRREIFVAKERSIKGADEKEEKVYEKK